MKRTIIFVHGFFGWGEHDPSYRVFPQWGMGFGNTLKDLRRLGWDCHAPSLGPISSAWDRACELYAQITGTRVDYGAAHSAKHGHERFGRTYDDAYAPNWSAENPIHLVAHSFGGATARLLLHLLSEGSAEEREACSDPSPLFLGGKADWVKSVTCIASPHNGTTYELAVNDPVRTLAKMNLPIAKMVMMMDEHKRYDFKLDHFGIAMSEGESFPDAVARIVALLKAHDDGGVYDLSVDGALALNKRITMPENVYYFAEPCCISTPRADGTHRPNLLIPPTFRKNTKCMGVYGGCTTPGGFELTMDWCRSDGLVNTLSAHHPFDTPYQELPADAKAFRKGIWNVMPVTTADHLQIQGFFWNPMKLKRFYRNIASRLEALE